MTFDEWYGGKPAFLEALDQRPQPFVAEVPRTLMGWIDPPRVTRRPLRRGRGRGRKVPRIVASNRPSQPVEHLFWWHPALKEQEWQRWRVKDGEKGPMIWEVKHVPFYLQGPDGLPGPRWHLVIARNVLDPTEMKFFVSNASPDTSVGTILLVAFSRWRVERCFEDGKGEIGLDHYEGRRYPGLKRHLILSAISYLFLAKTNQRLREKKIRVDRLPSAHRLSALIRSWWMNGRVSAKFLERTSKKILRAQRRDACACRCHAKRTCRVLRSMGIKLTETLVCKWNSS